MLPSAPSRIRKRRLRTQFIRAGGQRLPIDFTMHKTGDTWKVYELTVAAACLVMIYRSESASRRKTFPPPSARARRSPTRSKGGAQRAGICPGVLLE